LEAWAVVDNVSGEDWERVSVGVGSTSALSFRFDLHSVRFVERETLSDGQVLGLAPPTGGSPYTVAGKELQLLANVSLDDLNAKSDELAMPEDAEPPSQVASGAGRGLGGGMAAPASAQARPMKKAPPCALVWRIHWPASRSEPSKTKKKFASKALRWAPTKIAWASR